MRLASVCMAVGLLGTAGLVSAGKPADTDVESLVRDLGSSDPTVQERAAGAIRDCGAEAVPALRELLASPVGAVRGNALYAAGHLGAPARELLGEVTMRLADPLPPVRGAAALALASMGPAAAAAIPALEALRERDPDPLVRRIAGVALRGINPSPETPAGP